MNEVPPSNQYGATQMPLHLPVGGIFTALKALISPVEKLLFRRAYVISSLVHSYRQQLGRFPHELTDDVEYDIHWSKYYLRTEIACPLFWIRTRNDKNFSKIVLSVTASNSKLKYQDTLTLYDVGSVPIRSVLPSIPLRVPQKNILVKDNEVFIPYYNVETRLIELWDEKGKISDIFHGRSTISPLDRLEVAMGLEKGDIEKWGEIYNLGFIESEIREERIRLTAGYVMPRSPIDELKRRVFSQNLIVKISFWRKNLVFATQLTKEFNEFLKQQKKLDKFREERNAEREDSEHTDNSTENQI